MTYMQCIHTWRKIYCWCDYLIFIIYISKVKVGCWHFLNKHNLQIRFVSFSFFNNASNWMIFSPKNLFLLFTIKLTWAPEGWNEARRAEKEPRRGDLSPEGAGDAAQRLVEPIAVFKGHYTFTSLVNIPLHCTLYLNNLYLSSFLQFQPYWHPTVRKFWEAMWQTNTGCWKHVRVLHWVRMWMLSGKVWRKRESPDDESDVTPHMRQLLTAPLIRRVHWRLRKSWWRFQHP